MIKVHENIVLCGYPVQFLLILEYFCINRKVNLKKVSLYKPPPTPFWPCPAKQQGKILSFQLRGNTNRQIIIIIIFIFSTLGHLRTISIMKMVNRSSLEIGPDICFLSSTSH